MKTLHAGFVSSAIWDAIHKKKLASDLDWPDVLSSLSHFVIDKDIGGLGVLSADLSILDNILCRGLPTLPSLYIEDELQRFTGLINCETSGNSEISAYSCEIRPDISDRVFPLIERAFCVVAPKGFQSNSPENIFNEDSVDSSEFDSNAEKEFWNGPLPSALGLGGMQLVQRQRSLETIAGKLFRDQRADFSVQLPGSSSHSLPKGIIFEVDGAEGHSSNESRIKDDRRDIECSKAGWAKTYRHRLWKGVNATDSIDLKHPGMDAVIHHPYLQRANENLTNPLSSNLLGRRVKYLSLLPFSVARIQKVLIELIRGKILDLDSSIWNIAIVDRDGLSKCGEIAAKDFSNWLERIWAIYCPGRIVPEIVVHEISADQPNKILLENIDVLIDVSIELRYGVSYSSVFDLNKFNKIPSVTIRSDYFDASPNPALSFGDTLQPKIEGSELDEALTFFLRNIFRKKAFRPKQAEIISRALKGESVIALLPTGAGKSITYQLPTFLQNGLSIIVDPIKSLMKDQVDNLNAIGIQTSAFINSMSSAKERRVNTKLMQKGCFKFVFVSPERFIIQEFRDALDTIRREGDVYFAYVVVDEAHCVSEWGHDFRTAYLRLGVNARKFCISRLKELPLLALTGTASHDVLDDIHVELGYDKDAGISVRPESMERKNLKYKVVQLSSQPVIPADANDMKFRQIVGEAKLHQLPEIISSITKSFDVGDFPAFITEGKGSGLIFCPHSKWVHGAENIRNILSDAFDEVKDFLGVYYGGNDDDVSGVKSFDPIKTQNEFKDGSLKLLACTKAFGMGIDKPDIRFTLHYNIPPSLESFYQEAGRAGRDGSESQCWILYSGTKSLKSEQSLDYALNYSFHSNTFPGAGIEESKVFELLDENRVPGFSRKSDIETMLLDETGIECTIGFYHPANSNLFRIYINLPEYPEAKLYISVPIEGELSAGGNNGFPESENITHLVTLWLSENKPQKTEWRDWLLSANNVSIESGIEEHIYSLGMGHSNIICLSLDNGYLLEIATKLDRNYFDVQKAYRFVDGPDDFLVKLKPPISEETSEWIRAVFPKIRQSQHTFRAIYRLTVLGVIEDFVIDYSSATITASIKHLPKGAIREKLLNYIERYAPLEVETYLNLADQSAYPTELRRCLHALIQFVYSRIATQRKEALKIMEETTVQGIKDERSFSDAVINYFDSPYILKLTPHAKFYNPQFVFEICTDAAANQTKLSYLLGACNRLIPENPGNGAFHALRAYSISQMGYQDENIKDELNEALSCFKRDFNWGRSEIHDFLTRLRDMIPVTTAECRRVFEAAMIDDHALWLRQFNLQR